MQIWLSHWIGKEGLQYAPLGNWQDPTPLIKRQCELVALTAVQSLFWVQAWQLMPVHIPVEHW